MSGELHKPQKHTAKDDGWQASTLREALQTREWFMKNGKVKDALSRSCGVEDEITVESVERRVREVNDAIDQQHTKIDAETC